MRGEDEVIAIFLADIHLSINPPIWRSAEPDWLEAQVRPLLEIRDLQRKYGGVLNCPIICAGDIFDRWNTCPELINYAIMNLPDFMYAIPGQHDLPLHQYENIHRSAFWTLIHVGMVKELHSDSFDRVDNLKLKIFGFHFNKKIKVYSSNDNDNQISIAVVHDYIWIKGKSYPNAPEEKSLRSSHHNLINGKFYGYDIIIYGDNHQGFLTKRGETTIFNCGTLMRRKSDEIDYRPQVGLLLKSGEVVPHYLDISKDKYLETMDEEEIESELDMTSFMKELEKLGKTALDFNEAMKQFFHTGKTSDEAKRIILKAMEKK